LLGRIVIMQAGVIFGAMLARSYGTNAPMYIVVVLKLIFQSGGGTASGANIELTTSSGSDTVSVKLPDEKRKP